MSKQPPKLRKQTWEDLVGNSYDSVLPRKWRENDASPWHPIQSRETQRALDIHTLGRTVDLLSQAGIPITLATIKHMVPIMYQEGAKGGLQVKPSTATEVMGWPETRQAIDYVTRVGAKPPLEYILGTLYADRKIRNNNLMGYNGKGKSETANSIGEPRYDASAWLRGVLNQTKRFEGPAGADIMSMYRTGLGGYNPVADPRYLSRLMLQRFLPNQRQRPELDPWNMQIDTWRGR